MKAVLLDAETLGDDVDLAPLRRAVDVLAVFPRTTPDSLSDHLGDADLILTNKVVIPAAAMAGRRGIFVLATGTNNVDLKAAREQEVPVFNVTDYGTRSVAEHTLMMMLALASKLPLYQRDLRQGAWQRSSSFSLLGHRKISLAGNSLVLVGSGTIGSAVARLAEAFGMQVHYSARPGRSRDSRPAIDDLLGEADILSFHCPLTEDSRHLLDSRRLEKIKRGCLVINCARGGIIDEIAALEALRAGVIGGLGVDVLPEEPPVKGHPLLAALAEDLNLIVTPHNAWTSIEARQKIVDLTAANIGKLTGKTA